MQSDIMIVRMTDNDFFVSEKLHDREPYYKLIIKRAKTSTHYKTIEDARCAAEEMRNKIISTSPDCKIVEFDIRLYPKHDKQAKQSEQPIFYKYDNHHQKIFGITAKGKKVFDLPEDSPYIFIDKIAYENKLSNYIEKYENEPFSHSNLGYLQSFNFALNGALPYLRYEIYKAEELLKTFEWDKELYKCDMDFYSGYIDGLKTAIEIQKECVLQLRHDWEIHIFDLTKSHEFNVLFHSFNSNIGEYCLKIHNLDDDFIYNGKANELLIFFSDKTINCIPYYEKYQIVNCHYMEFDKLKKRNVITNKDIETVVERMFRLGHGDTDLSISDNLESTED